jgi:hypothetical protein
MTPPKPPANMQYLLTQDEFDVRDGTRALREEYERKLAGAKSAFVLDIQAVLKRYDAGGDWWFAPHMRDLCDDIKCCLERFRLPEKTGCVADAPVVKSPQ